MIKIKIGEDNDIKFKLNIRKTSDGNLMIFNHNDIDIVIEPGKNKIISFPKNSINDSIYHTQMDLMKFLARKGTIKRETIRGGNVFAAIEAEYPKEGIEGTNPFQLLLLSISKWLLREKPKMELEKHMEEEFEKSLLEPDDEESTELGEVPQEEKKGSLPATDFYFPRYMYD